MLFAATPLHLTVSTACPRPTFGPLSPPLASPSLPRQPRSPVELSCFWCDGHIILLEAFSAPAPSTAEFFRSLSPNIYPHLVPPPHHLLRYRWVTGPAGPSPSLARPRSSVCLRLNNPLGTRGPLSLASLLGAVRRHPISVPTGLLMSPTNRCVPTVARAGPAPAPLARIRHLHFPFRPPPSPPSLHGASVSLNPPGYRSPGRTPSSHPHLSRSSHVPRVDHSSWAVPPARPPVPSSLPAF